MKKSSSSVCFLAPLVMGLTILLGGCSYQYHEGQADVDGDQLDGLIQELSSRLNAQSLGNETAGPFFLEMIQDPNSTIYFSSGNREGVTAFGPIKGIVAITDWSFFKLSPSDPDIFTEDIFDVKVYFVDRPTESGSQLALLIDLVVSQSSEPITRVFFSQPENPPQFHDDKMSAELRGSSSVLRIRSFDVQDSFFNKNIQLALEAYYPQEGFFDIGKISILVGFAPE